MPILAYGCSKVGTTSIYDSLLAIGAHTRHLHAISGQKIIDTLQSLPSPVKIITGVREPLGKDLSLFFQGQATFEQYIAERGDFHNRLRNIMKDTWKGSQFLFGYKPSAYGMGFGWFDNEFKKNFGLNIFKTPFDREKGYTIYKKDNIEIFLYRLENLNNLESEIGEFINRPDFKLLHTNNAEEKELQFVYKELKKEITFPRAYVKLYYDDNARMDYFYSKEEKDAFLRKWRIDPQTIYG